MLKGEAKKIYQREYMRRRRSNKHKTQLDPIVRPNDVFGRQAGEETQKIIDKQIIKAAIVVCKEELDEFAKRACQFDVDGDMIPEY